MNDIVPWCLCFIVITYTIVPEHLSNKNKQVVNTHTREAHTLNELPLYVY